MEKKWYALYTRPRMEQSTAEALQQRGVEAFCPCVTEVRQWSDRKKKVQRPLIPSYVFVQLGERERGLVFQVPGVVRYLYWLGRPAEVRDSEIQQLQNWLKKPNAHVRLEGVQAGDQIVLNSGPFKGHPAEVLELNGQQARLILKEIGVKLTLCLS